ncbi:MAG: YiiD C-terminal domain-containing protein [Methylotenera sp.]|nr:YiiD C-terminal domain-containing protein [Methylotenera sp.]MDO9387913.1 YiiD C-terminal domain-containing protein [Methylotenera sp.]MDP2100979.1 YiiD C-terminal domain-containing protein [Methylotenera sp.]MDP2152376.1 YiiD C-terminal domain-containing protein [Methylotenera sp.]MDP2402485.1 YiiD C-terminal domain-containing protein [Methylotenera sp.]
MPLSLAMQICVVDVRVRDDSVTLRALLAPNVNHSSTIFGGSASAVAILVAWSLGYV